MTPLNCPKCPPPQLTVPLESVIYVYSAMRKLPYNQENYIISRNDPIFQHIRLSPWPCLFEFVHTVFPKDVDKKYFFILNLTLKPCKGWHFVAEYGSFCDI